MRIDLVAEGAKNIQGKMRLNADLESRRSLVSHPRRKAGKGVVKLVHNEKRGAASLKPPPNVHDLAKAGVKSVSDACFSLLFVGSMSPFRAAAEWSGRRCQTRVNVPQRRGVANAVSQVWIGRTLDVPFGRRLRRLLS